MNSDAARFVFAYDRAKKGWGADAAGPVAWALVPFDDSPVPPRALEKDVRRRTKALAKAVKGGSGERECVKAALAAANDYVALGTKHQAAHFVDRWQELQSLCSTYLA